MHDINHQPPRSSQSNNLRYVFLKNLVEISKHEVFLFKGDDLCANIKAFQGGGVKIIFERTEF